MKDLKGQIETDRLLRELKVLKGQILHQIETEELKIQYLRLGRGPWAQVELTRATCAIFDEYMFHKIHSHILL